MPPATTVAAADLPNIVAATTTNLAPLIAATASTAAVSAATKLPANDQGRFWREAEAVYSAL